MTSSRPLLFLITLTNKRDGVRKEKKLFKCFLIMLFQNTLFLKEFLVCKAVLGYLPKLKRGLGLAFGAHFLCGFSGKMFLT